MSEDNAAFRAEISGWMQDNLQGEYQCLRHRGGPGDEDAHPELRKQWEQHLARARWTCVGWPEQYGGRNLTPAQQVIFHEEYARAGGPGRVGHLGETLTEPTLIALGSEEQKQRFLPGIVAGTQYWCQGYSEPNAGSDLGNVQTKARQDEAGGDWIVDGQKVWTSLAHESQWVFVLARCEPGSKGNKGLIFLLMPLDQPGIEVRPIKQLTGTSEFSEVFFDGARARNADVVGAPGAGWKIAMALLGFERGLSTLGQQAHFEHELQLVCAAAKANGAARNPMLRNRIAQAWMGLKAMRYNAMRMLATSPDGTVDGAADNAGLIAKYYWSNWHRDFGKLAADVLGFDADIASTEPALLRLQQVFFFSRADTIYAGTNEIQLNIIAERGLGMPKEARPAN